MKNPNLFVLGSKYPDISIIRTKEVKDYVHLIIQNSESSIIMQVETVPMQPHNLDEIKIINKRCKQDEQYVI